METKGQRVQSRRGMRTVHTILCMYFKCWNALSPMCFEMRTESVRDEPWGGNREGFANRLAASIYILNRL